MAVNIAAVTGAYFCQECRVWYSPAVQLTLFHRGILKCWHPAPKQASHLMNIFFWKYFFIIIIIFSYCKECGLLSTTLSWYSPQIIIAEIQICSSRRLPSMGSVWFLNIIHRPLILCMHPAHQTPEFKVMHNGIDVLHAHRQSLQATHT